MVFDAIVFRQGKEKIKVKNMREGKVYFMNTKKIIPALVTPFDNNENIDYGALSALVERLIAQGVDGFYACGSTAECFLLTDDERKKVLETTIQAAKGRVPIIAHVGNIGTAKTVELAKHAKEAGASAVSSVPPFYYKFSVDEIAGYYESIAKAVDLPLIVYSIPALSGVDLTVQDLKKIVDASGAKGLKYTSYNLFELEKIRRQFPNLQIYNGHDEVMLNALPIGIDGAIGSTFNVMAPKFIALQETYEKGDLQTAAKMQAEINDIIEVMIKAGVNPSIKYWLGKAGIPCGNCRKPFAPVSPENAQLLDAYYSKVME